MTHLTVIVVNWNTRTLLARCLAAVFASDQAPEFEVWVVDNGSTDGSVEEVRQRFPQAHMIVNSTNVGFARANNQALAQAAGSYALLLNSDAILPQNGLFELVHCLDEHRQSAAAGPLFLNVDGSFQASYADFPSLFGEWLQLMGMARRVFGPYFPSHGPDDSQIARPADWLPGACLMVRLDAIRQIGLLDEGYFYYSEEVDWCYRFRQAGWQVWYLPKVRVTHYLSQSARQASETSLHHLYRGKLRFFSKHYGPLRATLLKCAVVVNLTGRAIMAFFWIGLRGAPRTSWQKYLGLAARLMREPTIRPA